MNPLVSVTLVTHNSQRFLKLCLDDLLRQDYPAFEVVVVDNQSTDGSQQTLAEYGDSIQVVYNSVNVGFAAGQNQAIALGKGDWVLTLNPDVRLNQGFISSLVQAGHDDPSAGVVCGKLLRAMPDLSIPTGRLFDSTGIYFTPCLRHFDRGWNEVDTGQYDRPEYVFGATAASALYRREMIDHISLDDGFFDPDFFAYREDADVAWRAQLLGWRCLYVPSAEGYHVRRVVPDRRKSTPAILRMHSVKNRFLMRLKNMTSSLYRHCWLPASARDVLVLGGCLFSEPASLPAFWGVVTKLRRAITKRGQVMERRVVDDDYVSSWFQNQPTSLPLDADDTRREAKRPPSETAEIAAIHATH
jgi:GT2 family glycosyltransferase